MSTTAMEDKKTVTVHEAKARDLQAKINALLNIEKVRLWRAYFLFS
jgi:kinetochore protein Nuf2